MESINPKKEWSVAIRVNHWLTALSIFALIATGLYIASPFTVPQGETLYKYAMGNVRTAISSGASCCASSLSGGSIWPFFPAFHADWRDFLAWTNWPNTLKQIRFYLLISKEPPDHTHLYGPIQALAYAWLFFLVFLIALTGLILMGAGYDAGLTALVYKIVKPFEILMGGWPWYGGSITSSCGRSSSSPSFTSTWPSGMTRSTGRGSSRP